VDVQYPTRIRYKQIDPIRITVKNRTTEKLGTLTVALDRTYVEAFSDVRAVPSFARPWEVELHEVRPGETRRVEVVLQGERYGLHRGTVSMFSSPPSTWSRCS
jgi:hypothetical protein